MMSRLQQRSSRRRGVSLAELIIVISIISLFTGIIAVRHKASLDRVRVEDAARNVLLELRELQVKGISAVDEVSNHAVGIYIDTHPGRNDRFYVFYDDGHGGGAVADDRKAKVDNNCNGSKECEYMIRLSDRYYMDVCYDGPCPPLPPPTRKRVSISFKRPDVRAVIRDHVGNYRQEAWIWVRDTKSAASKYIVVTNSGSIYLQ